MEKLGTLGGMGPELTLLCYKGVATGYKRKDKGGSSPALIIETVNTYEVLRYCRAQQYDKLVKYLLRGIYNLKKVGADFAILTSSTLHVVFNIVEKQAHILLLNIVEPTYQAVKAVGIKKVAWLRAGFTMEQECFKRPLMEHGIDVVVPDEGERALTGRIITKELELGIVNKESKREIDTITQRLIKEGGTEAVVMGCMESPLMYVNGRLLIPVFDTLKYRVQGIVEYMFRE